MPKTADGPDLKTTVSTRITPDLADFLDRQASSRGVTRSRLIADVLDRYQAGVEAAK
jgi:predicted transcriptional regulator